MKRIEVKKGTRLQSKGDRDRQIYHVESGLLRSYSVDHKGKEHIFMFAPEGWIVTDYVVQGSPCELFIETIEDSVLYVRPRSDVDEHHVEKLMKRLTVLQNRVVMLMGASAVERYQHFLNTYPDIAQRVPQKMIASYLGITPEALSKVKNNWLKNQ